MHGESPCRSGIVRRRAAAALAAAWLAAPLIPAKARGQSDPGGASARQNEDPFARVAKRLESEVARPGLALLLWDVDVEAKIRQPQAIDGLGRVQQKADASLQYFAGSYPDPGVGATLMGLQEAVAGPEGFQSVILKSRGELLDVETCLEKIQSQADPPADLVPAMECHNAAVGALGDSAGRPEQLSIFARYFGQTANGLYAQLQQRAADPGRPELQRRRDANAARRFWADFYGPGGIQELLLSAQQLVSQAPQNLGQAAAVAAELARRAQDFRDVLAALHDKADARARAGLDPLRALMLLQRADSDLRDAAEAWKAFAAEPGASGEPLARASQSAVRALSYTREAMRMLGQSPDDEPKALTGTIPMDDAGSGGSNAAGAAQGAWAIPR